MNYPPSFVGDSIYLIQNGVCLVPFTILRNGITFEEVDGLVNFAMPSIYVTENIVSLDKIIDIDEPYELVVEGNCNNKFGTQGYANISYSGVSVRPPGGNTIQTVRQTVNNGAGKVYFSVNMANASPSNMGDIQTTMKIKNLYLKRVRE